MVLVCVDLFKGFVFLWFGQVHVQILYYDKGALFYLKLCHHVFNIPRAYFFTYDIQQHWSVLVEKL